MPDLVRARIVVAGRVQGVFFRQATADEATRLGVRGWVRNLRDGRVEAEAEGDRASVEGLVRFCRRGPPAAHVEEVALEWLPYGGELGPFSVRR